MVIHGLIFGLLGLLLRLTRAHLRLTALDGGGLSAGAEAGECLGVGDALAVDLLPEGRLSLPQAHALGVVLLPDVEHLAGRGHALAKLLLTNGGLLLRQAHALAIHRLTKALKVLAGAGGLSVDLLADAEKLVNTFLLGCAVRLRRPQVDALLLLRCGERLGIALVQDAGINLRVGQTLLLIEVRRRDPGAAAAVSAGCDGVAKLARLGLLVLLVQDTLFALKHGLHVGRLELPDLASADLLRADGRDRAGDQVGSPLNIRITRTQGLTVKRSGLRVVGLRAAVSAAGAP